MLEDDVRVSEDDGRPQRVTPFTRKELLGPLERWFFGRQGLARLLRRVRIRSRGFAPSQDS